jgi:hypothetical protein
MSSEARSARAGSARRDRGRLPPLRRLGDALSELSTPALDVLARGITTSSRPGNACLFSESYNLAPAARHHIRLACKAQDG